MGIVTLTGREQDPTLDLIIDVCKSGSGVCGYKLREAHQTAGRLIGTVIAFDDKAAERYAVVIMMRAGLPFGIGIADSLEIACKRVQVFFSTKEKKTPNDLDATDYDKIILVDAVIKTGGEMIELADKLGAQEKIIYAANVLDETGKANFTDKQVYATRTSGHSFTGAKQKDIKDGKGPDTGDRLFNSGFME